MATEQKNTTSSSNVAVCMGYLLKYQAQTEEPVYCGSLVCAVW